MFNNDSGQKINLDGSRIKAILMDMLDNKENCGFDPYIVVSDEPRLRLMELSEERNTDGKTFRTVLKDLIFEAIRDSFLSDDATYTDWTRLADNQRGYLIIPQSDGFTPFSFLSENTIVPFQLEDISKITGLVFAIRKDMKSVWCYQHLWNIMLPKRKTPGRIVRISKKEGKTVFSEGPWEQITISKRIDILIADGCLITENLDLLQKKFGFQEFIRRSATKAVEHIKKTGLLSDTVILDNYISEKRGQRYARKMMRVLDSSVLKLSPELLFSRINATMRWNGKFDINTVNGKITLNNLKDVELFIDLLDERYTYSLVTMMEYDTNGKRALRDVSEKAPEEIVKFAEAVRNEGTKGVFGFRDIFKKGQSS